MNTTIEQKIEALKAKHKEELNSKIKTLTIHEEMERLTGLDFNVCDHGKYVSVYIENSRFDLSPKFDRWKIKEYYNAINKVYTHKNIKLTFAAKDPIETVSNCKIEFDNNTADIVWRHPQTCKISFLFDGIELSFKFPSNRNNGTFDPSIIGYSNFDARPNIKDQGDKWIKPCYYISTSELPKINYSGNQIVSYASNKKEANRIKDIAFNGK